MIQPSTQAVFATLKSRHLTRISTLLGPLTAAFCAASLLLASEFPAPYNSEPDKSSPLPAQEAAARMKLPPGFQVSVFASEPDVQNPIAMTWDPRGRLWVAENYTYAEPSKKLDLSLRDRILIFEDKNGRFSSRKVFTDQLQALTSLEVGSGGIWAMCPPNLLFIPDKDRDDVPDGPPQTVLDGFELPKSNYHNFANGLRFGPDGWLYGRTGGSAPGMIGAPGTPGDARVPVRGSLWRYHPGRKIFEALSTGTINPWGHDWDENGQLFFINTVTGHLWHQIPGAHYQSGGHPRTYTLIQQHADHWHFDTSQHWNKSKHGVANAYGGGHAHVGMMIYLGDNWPLEYRGRLLTWNMHGLRANQEILERNGSGYVGRHGPDLFLSVDPWFRGVDLSYGPDGGVFAIDWSDTGECHDFSGVHRASGRIYKFTHATGQPNRSADLTQLSLAELAGLHAHPNEWFVRQARRHLASKAAQGADLNEVTTRLQTVLETAPDPVQKLRALWTLHAVNAVDQTTLISLLQSEHEHVRVWALRLSADLWPLDSSVSMRPASRPEAEVGTLLPHLLNLARNDKSALVRLTLTSLLQRMPVSQRPALAAALGAHAEDAQDHNLPAMLWYGLIPVADRSPELLPPLAVSCELPLTRHCIARRLAEDIEKNPAPLNTLLTLAAASTSSALHADILAGLHQGLKGWRSAQKPAAWDAFARVFEVAQKTVPEVPREAPKEGSEIASGTGDGIPAMVRQFQVLFGDPGALEALKAQALNPQARLGDRTAALETVIAMTPPDLQSLCLSLLKTQGLNATAARGLATLNDATLAPKLLEAYLDFAPEDRPKLIAALVSRAAFSKPLLEAVASGQIPRTEITPFHARQIRGFNDAKLTARLVEVWGGLRDSTPDKQKQIAALKTRLTPAVLAKADLKQGQTLFAGICGACHMLNGVGGKIGPDLTGSGRDNLDYLLLNIVDPSAAIGAEYRMVNATLKDGRVLAGFLGAQTDRTLTVRMLTETATVERAQIATVDEPPFSLMPEGLLDALPEQSLRDLIAYLMDKRTSH